MQEQSDQIVRPPSAQEALSCFVRHWSPLQACPGVHGRRDHTAIPARRSQRPVGFCFVTPR